MGRRQRSGRGLTQRQADFARHYVATGNATQACRLAGYSGNDNALGVTGFENLRKSKILVLIKELRESAEKKASARILNATETLVGITRIAESDIADLFPDEPFLKAAKEAGVSRLIKTINFDKDTGKITKLEMYSAQTGLQDMGRYHKLFPTKIEITATEIDQTIADAVKAHNLPETFGGEPVVDSEM